MNNDRLKFRVWDENNKRYVYFDFFSYIQSRTTEIGKVLDISYSSCGDNLIDATYNLRQADKVEQCTGLRDKNGNLIYEGDIVKVPDDWDEYGMMAGETREVYYKDGGFRLKPREFDIKRGARGHWLEDDKVFEIIGNIHKQKDGE